MLGDLLRAEVSTLCVFQVALPKLLLTLSDDNRLYAFGSNEMGQLGLKRKITHTHVPQQVKFFDDLEILDISCGYKHSAVLTCSHLTVLSDQQQKGSTFLETTPLVNYASAIGALFWFQLWSKSLMRILVE